MKNFILYFSFGVLVSSALAMGLSLSKEHDYKIRVSELEVKNAKIDKELQEAKQRVQILDSLLKNKGIHIVLDVNGISPRRGGGVVINNNLK